MTTIIGARGRKCRSGRAGLILSFLVPLAFAVAPRTVDAQTCGFPVPADPLTGVINSYYPGVGTAAAGATSISVGTRVGSPAIASGDLLLVIQMQDADINVGADQNTINYGDDLGNGRGVTSLNSAGLYEYVVANSTVSGGAVQIRGNGNVAGNNGLVNTYRTAAAGAQGQRRFQVIRVPQYASATFGAALTAARWNGATGGVLALDVAGTLTLNNSVVSVDGLGFRGAGGRPLAGDTSGTTGIDYVNTTANAVHGGKGEGIAGTPRWVYDAVADLAVDLTTEGYPGGSMARGAPGNAGGGGTDPHVSANDENAGGGGGANAGDGGGGGNSWNSNLPRGGVGGDALAIVTVDRQIMGGGGGAGDRNDCGPSHGAAGGGIVFIRAGAVAGTGTITARGVAASSSGNDGAGGGGGGGRILITAATGTIAGLTALVTGGNGGYANVDPAPGTDPACASGTSHGPGGGGGGGAIFASSAPGTTNVNGGAAGFTNTVNGTFNATTNYSATGGGNGFVTTGVTQLIGVQDCSVATRASVCGLRVDPSGTVEFATSSQRGTLGFDLFETNDPTGRRGRVRLTDRALTSPVPSSDTPILYRAETAPITAPYLVIEEIEVKGQRRTIGPFRVGDDQLRLGFERIEKWASESEGVDHRGSRLLSSRRRARVLDGDQPRRLEVARGLKSPRRATEALKLETSAAGPVQVAVSTLEAAGLPTVYANRPDMLRLTNLGRPVPFRVSMDLMGRRSLEFTAEALSTDYSGQNAYVVSWGADLPPVPAVAFTASGFPRLPGFVRIEENVFNAAFVAQGADPWIWDALVSGAPAGPYLFDLPGLRASGGVVAVRVGVIGGSDHWHTVRAFLNGQPAGALKFSGKKAAVLEGVVSAGALRPSGNELSLTYTAAASTDEDPGLLFLDVLDLGAPVEPPSALVSIDQISAYDASLPAGAGADYLIVTHAAFADQALRIAALKEAEGHRARVVDVENVYDRFSGGVMEPAAVQALIRQAVHASARFVLLIGDDTFDPRNFSGLGQVSYMPSLFGWDGEYGRVPSENRYADVDGDGSPDVAIGRLPVQTPAEAEVMVEKISRQAEVMREAGQRHLLVVDNQAPRDPSFTSEAERVAALLGAGAATSWADLSQGTEQARADLLEGLAAGPLATHYFGHGGEDFWADEHLFAASDVATLGNAGHETVLFAWTCVSQNYLFGLGPSLGEAMLLAPEGGALATVGPTGITDARRQALLFSRLYPYVLKGVSLGEALRLAKAEALRLDPESRGVVEGWSLLGDPALTFPVRGPRRLPEGARR